MPAGPPYGNKNAEKWSFKKSVRLFNDAIKLTEKRDAEGEKGFEFDFIGEIAGELGTFKHIFGHLCKRFKALKRLDSQLHTNIERNCYYNGKKGVIKEASAIMNLKSNHRWTDRLDTTTKDEPINDIKLSSGDIKKLIEGL